MILLCSWNWEVTFFIRDVRFWNISPLIFKLFYLRKSINLRKTLKIVHFPLIFNFFPAFYFQSVPRVEEGIEIKEKHGENVYVPEKRLRSRILDPLFPKASWLLKNWTVSIFFFSPFLHPVFSLFLVIITYIQVSIFCCWCRNKIIDCFIKGSEQFTILQSFG